MLYRWKWLILLHVFMSHSSHKWPQTLELGFICPQYKPLKTEPWNNCQKSAYQSLILYVMFIYLLILYIYFFCLFFCNLLLKNVLRNLFLFVWGSYWWSQNSCLKYDTLGFIYYNLNFRSQTNAQYSSKKKKNSYKSRNFF